MLTPYPYEVLEVSENAGSEEIRAAYVRKIQAYPPEKHPQKFQEIAGAYQLIKDDIARSRLKVFGMKEVQKIADLLPMCETRHKVGLETWLNVNKENG